MNAMYNAFPVNATGFPNNNPPALVVADDGSMSERVWQAVDWLLDTLRTEYPRGLFCPKRLRGLMENNPALTLAIVGGFVWVHPTAQGDYVLCLPGTFEDQGRAA